MLHSIAFSTFTVATFTVATLTVATLMTSSIALPTHADPAQNPIIPRPVAPSSLTTQPAIKPIPKALVDILQKDIQTRWRVPIRTLSVNVAQPRLWDACMGIPPRNGVCAEIGIPGWQVVIKGQNRYWVYNTDSNGKRIAYNANASQPHPMANTITPNLIDTPSIVPTLGENIIFQSSMVTGHVMAYYSTTLSEDGTLRRRTLTRGDQPESTPKVVKKLTPQQLQQFKSRLINNRFPHFDRMSYFNPGAIAADAGSLQFSSFGTVAEYTLGTPIPKNLASIANAWEDLLKDTW